MGLEYKSLQKSTPFADYRSVSVISEQNSCKGCIQWFFWYFSPLHFCIKQKIYLSQNIFISIICSFPEGDIPYFIFVQKMMGWHYIFCIDILLSYFKMRKAIACENEQIISYVEVWNISFAMQSPISRSEITFNPSSKLTHPPS